MLGPVLSTLYTLPHLIPILEVKKQPQSFCNLPKVTELTNSGGIQKPVLLTTASGQIITSKSSAGPSQLD